MGLGNHLFDARKNKGLSQEAVAERLGVSRQTISKWETDETLPDIRQAKRLATLYGVTLDDLITFDLEVQEIREAIDRTSQEVSDKIDWNRMWSKKYPILARYREEVEVERYGKALEKLLDGLKREYGYGETDALLVLKDILATVWQERKG